MTDYKRPRGHKAANLPIGQGAPDPGVLTGPFHRGPWDRDDPRTPQKWDVPPHGWQRSTPRKKDFVSTGASEYSRDAQRRRPTPRTNCEQTPRRSKFFPELYDEFTVDKIKSYPDYVPERYLPKTMSQFAAIAVPGYAGTIPAFVPENIIQADFTKANQLSLTARRGYLDDHDNVLKQHFAAARHYRNHSDGGRDILQSMKRRGEIDHSKGSAIRNYGVLNVMP